MIFQRTLDLDSRGRGTREITAAVQEVVQASGITTGLCHVFSQHTSASLMLCENADPVVREDLERLFTRLVPDGDPLFRHTAEGDDDMPAHARALLTHSDLTLPVGRSRCLLGVWQGIYLWEHRHGGRRRRVTVTVQGE